MLSFRRTSNRRFPGILATATALFKNLRCVFIERSIYIFQYAAAVHRVQKNRVKYQRLKYGPYDRFNSLPFPHFFDLHTPFGLTGLPLKRSAVINIMDHMAYVPIGTYKALVQVIQKKTKQLSDN